MVFKNTFANAVTKETKVGEFFLNAPVEAFGVNGRVVSLGANYIIVKFEGCKATHRFGTDGRQSSWHKKPSLFLKSP